MKNLGLKLLLYLLASVALGTGSGVYHSTDSFDYANFVCNNNPEFEDDICFDILVHHIQLDLMVDDYIFVPTPISRSFLWLSIDNESVPDNHAIALPLRAPPSIG